MLSDTNIEFSHQALKNFKPLVWGQISAWFALISCVLRHEIEFTDHQREERLFIWWSDVVALKNKNRTGVKEIDHKASFGGLSSWNTTIICAAFEQQVSAEVAAATECLILFGSYILLL